MTMALTLLALLLLYLLAALFCCIETAFTSANLTRLRDAAEQGDVNASVARRLLGNSGAFFGTVLLGTNLVHVSITTLAGAVLATAFLETDLAAGIGLGQDARGILTSSVITPTLLLFTEIIPKAVGRAHADELTLLLAKVLDFLRMLLSVPVACISWISGRLASLFGVSTDAPRGLVSREDLKILASVAEEHGVLQRESGQMMASMLELDTRTIGTIMVPLVEVRSLPVTATIGDVEALVKATGYTRFPVYESRIDEIVGIISMRRCMFENGLYADDISHSCIARQPIAPLVERSIGFVPETKTVGALLSELGAGHSPMTAVVDEYGGVVGVVTTEDLIGLLIGGISDLRNQSSFSIRRMADGVFECDGKTGVQELSEALGMCIENSGGYGTAAGLALKLFGRIPQRGATVRFGEYEIRVMEVGRRRITKLRFVHIGL